MPWSALTLAPPAGLAAATAALDAGFHAVKTGLDAARAVATAALALNADVAAVDPGVGALVTATQGALAALLDDTGAHALLVPLPKKGMLGLVPGTGPALVTSHALEADATKTTPLWRQAFDPDALFTGGNAWFLRCLAGSLADAGDDARPTFTATSRWAYALVVAGASDVTALLTVPAFLTNLLGLGGDTNAVPADRGAFSRVPQNVRVVPTRTGARVQWDAVPVAAVVAAFDSVQVTATAFAIIRTTDFVARGARRVTDLFGATPLRPGLTGAFGAVVLAVATYDGVTNRWVDTAHLEDETDYFYFVAFATKTGDRDNGYVALSSAAPFRRAREATPHVGSHGALPDWTRTPSVARLVPAVGDALDLVGEELGSLRDTVAGADAAREAFTSLLAAQSDTLLRKAEELTRYVQRVTTTLTPPAAGLHAFTGTGAGGTGAFLADVAAALDAPGDADRPEFDDGSEFVTGVVLLAVDPDPTKIAAAFEALKLLFGGGAVDPARAGVDAIVAPTPADVATTTAATPVVAFDDAMRPTTGPDSAC